MFVDNEKKTAIKKKIADIMQENNEVDKIIIFA